MKGVLDEEKEKISFSSFELSLGQTLIERVEG